MIALLFALFVAGAQPQYPVGQRAANITMTDEYGRGRRLEDYRGQPLVIAPIYSRCPLACPLIASALRRAAAAATTPQRSYRVLVFSFDPRDTPADLRRFRSRHNLPPEWTIATARASDIRHLTDSLGFHYATIPGGFTHPNVVFALTPDLRVAKPIFGTSYPPAELDAALAVARGGIDWVGSYGGIALAALLFFCTLAAAYLVMLMTRG